jgi:hypothetical protein
VKNIRDENKKLIRENEECKSDFSKRMEDLTKKSKTSDVTR